MIRILFSDDGNWLTVCNSDAKIEILRKNQAGEYESYQIITFDSDSDFIAYCDMSGDGQFIGASDAAKVGIYVFNSTTSYFESYQNITMDVNYLDFTNDGRYLAITTLANISIFKNDGSSFTEYQEL